AGRGLYVALFLFVAIPLPGTGAWTGILASSILDMDFKRSVLATIGGVISAALIVYLTASGILHVGQVFSW
ncbi:MAG TPA: small multi-drug export protein, partial [Clostridia bacterium]|nr:small multi-drug export protein [Clostridia bacterium]